jgi:hypothetical protein
VLQHSDYLVLGTGITAITLLHCVTVVLYSSTRSTREYQLPATSYQLPGISTFYSLECSSTLNRPILTRKKIVSPGIMVSYDACPPAYYCSTTCYSTVAQQHLSHVIHAICPIHIYHQCMIMLITLWHSHHFWTFFDVIPVKMVIPIFSIQTMSSIFNTPVVSKLSAISL